MVVRNIGTTVYTRPVSISKFGILSRAAEVITDNNNDWVGGFTYDTIDGKITSTNQTILGTSTHTEAVVVSNEGDPVYRYYYPFDVETTIELSTMGSNPDAVLDLATRALDVVLQKNIEREFWTGTLSDVVLNRSLSQTDVENLTPGASTITGVRVKHGLAILERALGDSTIGSAGVIHATRDVASILDCSNEDNALVTKLGNFVIAGSGYTGSGPADVAPPAGMAWMYATGPVTVRVGSINVTPESVGQAVDSSNNTIKYFVDRPAAVTWSTSKLYAVLVDLSLDLA